MWRVGNEDWFDRSGSDRNGTYDGRFAQFSDAIKKQYPQLKVISSCGYEQPKSLWVNSRTAGLGVTSTSIATWKR